MAETQAIRLVVFDLAGTTIDFGCFAPVTPFIETLRSAGISVSTEAAREPMGLHKRDHLRMLLQMPDVRGQWEDLHGGPPGEADVDRLYEQEFIPRQLEAVPRHSELVPGLLECQAWLRERQIKIATTTGYFPEAHDRVVHAFRDQGFLPDFSICAGEVPAGRPEPWMIFRAMEATGVFPPSRVVKVGDTVPDIREGCHAGAWSVGVTHSSSHMGLSADEFALLDLDERRARVRQVSDLLEDAGAHLVLDTVADVPRTLDRLERRLLDGRRP